MSVKHVREYFEQVASQYKEMIDDLREAEKDLENNIVEPEYIEQIKKNVQPVKDNYMTLSWIMYLLNQPERKQKQRGYEQRNAKLLKTLDNNRSPQAIIKQNEDSLKNLK